MKINWRVRFRNPQFLFQILLAIGTPLLAYYGLVAEDLNTWGSVFELFLDALSNPYVLGLIGVSVYNALNDPTVAGLNDSFQALEYEKPKKENVK